jgi:raffinose/stachyose/melibiose transport system substrate-binding protein
LASVKRFLIVIGAAGMAAVTLVSSAPAKPSDTVSLNMSMLTTYKPAFDTLIPNFQRVYPNVQINVTYAPNGTFQQVLLTQLQAGSLPDLFWASLGNQTTSSVRPLASSGNLLDLSGAPWDNRIPTAIKTDALQYNGKTYGYPFTMFTFGAAYNTDLMKKYGLKVPTTFAQVLSFCQAAKAAGTIAFAQPLNNNVSSVIQRMGQYVYTKDPNWNDLRTKHKRSFRTTTGWARAFQSIIDMNNAGCFQPGPEATTAGQSYAMVANGQALGSVLTSGELAVIKGLNPNINLVMYNLPGDTADQNMIVTSGSALSASAKTAHPKEAKEFIQFLSRPKQAALFNRVQGAISYYDLLKGNFPDNISGQVPLAKAGKIIITPTVGFPNPIITFPGLGNVLIGVMLGRTTMHDGLASLDYLWDNPAATAAP